MRDLLMRLSTPRIFRINYYLALIHDLTVYGPSSVANVSEADIWVVILDLCK
jgi:hypothetical protein